MTAKKPTPAPKLDRLTELETVIYPGLAREFGNADTSSARASLSQQMRRTLVEIESLGKGASEGSGIDELAGRRAGKAAAKVAKPPAKRKAAAAKKSRTPAKTAARKAAPRRRGKPKT